MKRCAFIFLIGLLSCIPHSAKAEKSPANDFAGQIISDGKKGRVGIGTKEPAAALDVSGEIKLGSTGAPCTKGLSGTLRSVNSKLQFCDGAGWRNVSLDKEP